MSSNTYTWAIDGYGSWSSAANWTPGGGPPEPGDAAIIDAGHPVVSNETLAGLTISFGPSGTSASGMQFTGTNTLAADTVIQDLTAGVMREIALPGTLINHGIILAGTTDAVLEFQGQNSTLVSDGTLRATNGGSLHVAVDAFSNAGTINATDAGTVTISTEGFVNTGTLSATGAASTLQIIGQSAVNSGLITASAGAGLTIATPGFVNDGTLGLASGAALYGWGANAIINNGRIDLDGSDLSLYRYVNSQNNTFGIGVAGTGEIALSAGATLDISSAMLAGQTVTFLDGYDRLTIDDVNYYSSTNVIAGMQAGDIIDLTDVKADAATFVPGANGGPGTLDVFYEGSITASFAMDAPATPITFTATPDRGFGTLLLSSAATRVWRGGTGRFYDAANWTTTSPDAASAPLPGDTLDITSGEVQLDASESMLSATTVVLDGSLGAAPVLRLDAVSVDVNSMISFDPGAYGEVEISGDDTIFGRAQTNGGGSVLRFTTDSGASLTIDGGTAISALTDSTLQLAGSGSIIDDGLIVVNGTASVDAGVFLGGTSGVVEIKGSGHFIMDGTLGSGVMVQMDAPSETLTIGNVANFAGTIANFQQGDTIDLPTLQADGWSYSYGTLTLTEGGSSNPVATLYVGTGTWYAGQAGNFVLQPDGLQGTKITYEATPPIVVQQSIPVAAMGDPASQVSLRELLVNAFGTVPAEYTSFILSAWSGAQEQPSESYWGTPVDPVWFVNGQPVTQTETIAAADLDSVTFQVGDSMISTASFAVTSAGTDANPAAQIQYQMWSTDPSVDSTGPGTSNPTAAQLVASAARFEAEYTNQQNTDNCNWIADDVAAAMGATMPWYNFSTDPTVNTSGGFWRIAYNSADAPVSNWSTLVQAGDIVRMAWAGLDDKAAGEHTTTVLDPASTSNDAMLVYDNNYWVNGTDFVGNHFATYWDATLSQGVTIYRLSDQYLIQGAVAGQFIQGSVFNNLIEPGFSGDTIAAGAGMNEIADVTANLDDTTITDFHAGDWLDFEDLAPADAAASYDAGTGALVVQSGGNTVATLSLPDNLADDFIVSADGAGGTRIDLACFRSGTRIATPAGERAVETIAAGDAVLTAQGAHASVVWAGQRTVRCDRHPAPRQVWPVRISAGAFGDALPARDLYLSPNHAIFADGVLIPVRLLVNGSTIVQVAQRIVRYHHIELARHNLLLSEGLPTESFLPGDDRGNFDNGGDALRLHPDFATIAADSTLNWEAAACAPLVVTGPVIDAVRARLGALATSMTAAARTAAA